MKNFIPPIQLLRLPAHFPQQIKLSIVSPIDITELHDLKLLIHSVDISQPVLTLTKSEGDIVPDSEVDNMVHMFIPPLYPYVDSVPSTLAFNLILMIHEEESVLLSTGIMQLA